MHSLLGLYMMKPSVDENWVWVCEPDSSNLHVLQNVISILLKAHKQGLLLIITSEFTEKESVNRS